jgi:hypothetical protein
MTVAFDLLAEAQQHGVTLVPTPSGKIKASARTPPPADLVAKLRAYRAELVVALAECGANAFQERAAIIAEGTSAPLEWCEGFAALDIANPPADVPTARWRLFIDDCGRYLDGWAGTAAALGWGPLDLFGCNATHPFACIDQAGLLWLLGGSRIVALTDRGASVISQTGLRQPYRRKPSQPGQILAWELA